MIPTFLVQPLLYLAGIAALGGALWWTHHYIYTEGYNAAKTEVTAQYAARDKEAEAKAQAKIKELEATRRAVEKEAEDSINRIANQFEKERQNANKIQADLRARLAAGTLRLRDPGAASANADSECRVSQASAATSGSDGGTTGQLSTAASDFLISLAGEADEVARQLAACQAVIRSDRK